MNSLSSLNMFGAGQLSFSHRHHFMAVFLSWLLLISLVPTSTLQAQLQDMKITPLESSAAGNIVVLNHSGRVIVTFRSSITTLNFTSNLQIIDERSNPEAGEYLVIIEPENQIITVSAPGYIAERVTLRGLEPNQRFYYSVEPVFQSVTDTGSLLVRSNPPGARFTILGIPGEHITPASFDELLAQTYTIRLRLEDYEPVEDQISVDPLHPNLYDVDLVPTFGFLRLDTENAQLSVSTEAVPDGYRITYTPGQQQQLPVGRYPYRLSRRFYRDATGTFEIRPGEITPLAITLEPDYATLRVRTNVSNFTLSAEDNEAPQSNRRDIINLERGERTVTVRAPGYAPERIQVIAAAGAAMDTTVTLVSTAALQERQRREQLPRGILNLTSDVDAEIYINGELQGTRSISMTMVPDRYRVEMRHALGTEAFTITVPSADIAERHVTFLPLKSTAITRAAVVPGMGHMYTKRSRGYVYLAAAAAAAGFAAYSFFDYQSIGKDHDRAITNYRNASSSGNAAMHRSEIESLYASRLSARDNILMGAGVFGAIYLLQLVDVAVTSPQFGYRTQNGQEFRAGIAAGGIGVQYRF